MERRFLARALSRRKVNSPRISYIQMQLLQAGMPPGRSRVKARQCRTMSEDELLSVNMVTCFFDRIGGLTRHATPRGDIRDSAAHWQVARALALIARHFVRDHSLVVDFSVGKSPSIS